MTKDEFILTVMASPEVRALTKPDEPGKHDLCNHYTDVIVTSIVMSYTWDFAMDVADETLVVDQALYVLKGNSNDCRRIKSVRYGDSGANDEDMSKVGRLDHIKLDDWLERNSPSVVEKWVNRRPVQNYPRIQLVAAPSTTGKIVRYRYWVGSVTFDDLPKDIFDMAMLSGVRYLLNPVLRNQYYAEVRRIIEEYQPPSGEIDTAMIDPQIVLENRNRYNRIGW